MDFLNKTFAQARELFLSMTPGARITSGLLLAVVVVSLAFLFRQGHTAPDEYLFGGEPFAGSQIPQVEAALATAGNDFQIVGNRVKVPGSKRDSYIAAVADAGALPRDFESIMRNALESGSAWENREKTRWRNQALRESQLSHLVNLMPWVEQASVLFTIEEPRALSSVAPASATVSVLPKPGELLDGQRIRNIQRLVAGYHPSLQRDKVTVTNLGEESQSSSEVTAEDFDEDYWRTRTSYEKLKRENIFRVLSYIPGVRVQVSADLDETYPAGEGQSGLEANGPNRRGTNTELAAQNRPKPSRSSTNEKNAIGFSESVLSRGDYKEKEVFASIAVPRDYIIHVWKQLNPPSEGQPPREPDDNELKLVQTNEVSKIENLVKPLLPRDALGENEYKQVHVEVVNSIARESLPEPSLAESAVAWTGRNWGLLSMLGLTVFSLLVLRSMVRSSTSGQTTPTVGAPTLHSETPESCEQEDPNASAALPGQRLRLRKLNSFKEDLAEIVREDPEAAATVLRNWIGNAS